MAHAVPIKWGESGREFRVYSEVPDRSNSGVSDAVIAARGAFESWKSTEISERLSVIGRFRKMLASRSEAVAELLCGSRSAEEFLTTEIIPLLDGSRFLEKHSKSVLRSRTMGAWRSPLWLRGLRHEVRREPLGVVLVIGPSNYPLFLPAIQALQAIVAGNSVLLKPAPTGQPAALLLNEMLGEAGLPNSLLQLLPTSPEGTCAALSAGVDKVILTGSFETGRQVMLNAAMSATPSVVELSGCDGVFILPDADINVAAECVAFGLTLNSGHTCIAPRRAFVWKSVAEPFKKALLRALASRSSIILRDQDQTALRNGIVDAVNSGARLLNGSLLDSWRGSTHDSWIEGPIVLSNLSPQSEFVRRENWGPILSIIEVSSEAEAISAFNQSDFGLGASIFTASPQSASHIASSIVAGSICVNDLIVPTADGRLPFAGRKQSGFGATRGPEGLLEMTAVKVVSIRTGRTHFHLKPPMPNQLQVLSAYADAAYGSRWRGFASLFTAIRASLKLEKSLAKKKDSDL